MVPIGEHMYLQKCIECYGDIEQYLPREKFCCDSCYFKRLDKDYYDYNMPSVERELDNHMVVGPESKL